MVKASLTAARRYGWALFLARISHQGVSPGLKVSMVNIRTATPQMNRFGTDAERGQSSEWEAVMVEKLRVLWSKV
jgi:hypothetical protein